MKRAALLVLLTATALAAPQKPKQVPIARRHVPQRVESIAPTPRPTFAVDAPDQPIALSKAMPGKALASLPSSATQLQSLSGELKKGTPALSTARQKSDSLAAEAASLRRKLVETAARIEQLERQTNSW